MYINEYHKGYCLCGAKEADFFTDSKSSPTSKLAVSFSTLGYFKLRHQIHQTHTTDTNGTNISARIQAQLRDETELLNVMNAH